MSEAIILYRGRSGVDPERLKPTTITSNGIYEAPITGTYRISCVGGGGGGGGGCRNSWNSSQVFYGSAGSRGSLTTTNVTLNAGDKIQVNLGAGGAGGTNNTGVYSNNSRGTNGSAGGTTTFGSLVSGAGGTYGQWSWSYHWWSNIKGPVSYRVSSIINSYGHKFNIGSLAGKSGYMNPAPTLSGIWYYNIGTKSGMAYVQNETRVTNDTQVPLRPRVNTSGVYESFFGYSEMYNKNVETWQGSLQLGPIAYWYTIGNLCKMYNACVNYYGYGLPVRISLHPNQSNAYSFIQELGGSNASYGTAGYENYYYVHTVTPCTFVEGISWNNQIYNESIRCYTSIQQGSWWYTSANNVTTSGTRTYRGDGGASGQAGNSGFILVIPPTT